MNTYSPRQVQCMQAMGLVPWVRRDATAAIVHAPDGDTSSAGGVPIEGKTDAQVMLIFSNAGAKAAWPLNQADDALLDGMLRAIGLSKAEICTCCVSSDADLARVAPTSSQQQFLYFGPIDTADTSLELQSMTLHNDSLNGWRLPSLEILRNEPQRKRHAWITLKQLRAALDQL